MTEETNEALLEKYAQGDFDAFEQLYQRNKGGVYRYLMRQVRDPVLVDDLFQDIWAKIITHASKYQQSAGFTTWLYTIARHKVIDHIRHLKVLKKVIEDDIEDLDHPHNENDYFATTRLSPEIAHDREQQAKSIEECLQKLPRHQLDCFLLREEAGLSVAAIAQLVEINLEAAKSRLKSGYKNLRACLSVKLHIVDANKIKPATAITKQGIIND